MGTLPNTHRFQKVRADHFSERAEDYVEAIAELGGGAKGAGCRVGALARHLEVSHVTVVQALQRLSRRGLVTRQPRGPVTLTAAGRRMAQESCERHALVLSFLRWLGVPEKVAERDAEGLEHHASDETLARMRAAMQAARSAEASSTRRRPSDALRLAAAQRGTRAPKA